MLPTTSVSMSEGSQPFSNSAARNGRFERTILRTMPENLSVSTAAPVSPRLFSLLMPWTVLRKRRDVGRQEPSHHYRTMNDTCGSFMHTFVVVGRTYLSPATRGPGSPQPSGGPLL